MIRNLLRALRLDDVLALLFTGALLIVGGILGISLVTASLRYFLGLIVFYGLLFAMTRQLARSARISGLLKELLMAGLVLLLLFFTIVVPGEFSLETARNLLVLSFPVAVGWWTAGRAPDRESGPGSVIRDFAPWLVSSAAYLMLHDVVHRLSPIDRDGWLIAADERLFGGAWTRGLEPFVHPALTEWFSATYSLFIFFPLTLALWFTSRGERRALRHLLLAVVVCNYLGYIGYLLVPAIGPMFTLHYDIPLRGGWFFQIKESLDELGRVPRDCFPSLHTANTFVALLICARYARPLLWVYLPLGASCIAATIYLRYHYTIDVVAGFLLGGLVVWATPKLSRGWDRLAGRPAESAG